MKEIEEYDKTGYTTRVDKGTKISFITDDGIKYVFWDLTWYDYPIFSHREYGMSDGKIVDIRRGRNQFASMIHSDSRNFNLPEKIKERIFDEYGGYYMADGEVEVKVTEKRGYTIIRPKVGDMYPLRKPSDQ